MRPPAAKVSFETGEGGGGGGAVVELLAVGAVGALDAAVELGAAWRQGKEEDGFLSEGWRCWRTACPFWSEVSPNCAAGWT